MNTSAWPKNCGFWAVAQTIITPDIHILPNFGFLMVPKTVKFTSKNGIKTHSEMGKERGEKIHPILVALVQRSISALLCNTHRALSREWHGSRTHRYLLPKVQAARLSQSNRAAGQRPTLALFYISMQRNYSWQLLPTYSQPYSV